MVRIVLMSLVSFFLVVNCAFAAPFAAEVQQPLHKALAVQRQSQRQADKWEEKKQRLLAELEQLEQQQTTLEQECGELQQQVAQRRNAIAEQQRAVDEAQRLTSQMEPFLRRTLQLLQQQVDGDLPFLRQERAARLRQLQSSLADDTLSISEKFRRLFEALRIEAEYGSSVEVKRDFVTVAGHKVLMNRLRVGRLALFAQTLDKQHSYIYDLATDGWKALDAADNGAISRAIAMGEKRRPVSLVTLPLGKVVAQ